MEGNRPVTDNKATVHLRAENGSLAALHVGNVTLGHLPAGIDGPTGTVLDGVLKPLGYVSADGIEIKHDDSGDETKTFGGDVVRTMQDRRDISFSFNIEHVDPTAWHAVFGAPQWYTPPAPTLRSATRDACAALRTLLRIMLWTLRTKLRPVGWRLADALVWPWVDPLAVRWIKLRRYPWRRLPGPVFRLWDKQFNHLHTEHGRPESLRKWARRCTAHVWKVLRHG